MQSTRSAFVLLVVTGLTLCGVGCNSGGGPTALEQVGTYPPPSSAIGSKPRIAITTLAADDDPAASMSRATLGETAADQFAELLTKTRRFNVVKRDEFASLLSQQALGDMVRPGMVTRRAAVSGVDYILVGSITNLSITKTAESTGWWDTVKDTVTRAPDKSQVKITANCGVEFKLVDPATGDWQVPSASEFYKEAGANDFGIDVSASANATQAGASIPVTREDRERIIRLALDDAIRKNLTKIDRFLASRPEAKMKPAEMVTQTPTPHSAPNPMQHSTSVVPTQPSPAPAAAKVVCPNCGAENDPSATFCRRCGSKLR